jgi:predicted dehydrogenase
MSSRWTRRRFLQSTAAASAAGLATNVLPAADKQVPPSERLRVGMIGTTNQAGYNLNEVVKAGVEIVALCDVDERRAGPVRERFPKAKFHVDWRRVIDQRGLDAVVVATPDHIHALATLAALRNGLHVYCEKPLTHTVEEARLVAETAAKHKRVTQMGTQIHAGSNYRRVVELVQSGAIGTIRGVHVWVAVSRGGWERPKGSEPVPKGLHWDLWLGPALVRPFFHGTDKNGNGVYHPFNWRYWWDFGGGSLADMACHHMDLPFWALGLRHPTKVSAQGPPPDSDSAAAWTIVRYEFPARGTQPPVMLTWYDGGKRPPHFHRGELPEWGDGTLFIGSKGMLLAGYESHRLLPQKDYADFVRPPQTIKDSIGHHREWVEACKSGGPTTCNFDYGGALTECALLGVVSYRLGKSFTWDAAALKASEPEAERFLKKEYRKPWSLT